MEMPQISPNTAAKAAPRDERPGGLAIVELEYENEDRDEDGCGEPERKAAADQAKRKCQTQRQRRQDAPVFAKTETWDPSLRNGSGAYGPQDQQCAHDCEREAEQSGHDARSGIDTDLKWTRRSIVQLRIMMPIASASQMPPEIRSAKGDGFSFSIRLAPCPHLKRQVRSLPLGGNERTSVLLMALRCRPCRATPSTCRPHAIARRSIGWRASRPSLLRRHRPERIARHWTRHISSVTPELAIASFQTMSTVSRTLAGTSLWMKMPK